MYLKVTDRLKRSFIIRHYGNNFKLTKYSNAIIYCTIAMIWICEMYMGRSLYIYIEQRNLEIWKTRNNFSVQVRNFLLPLSLKVLRHKEKEAQSFYSGIFICPHPTRVAPATKVSASKRKPTVFSRGRSYLYSTNWLFQNLPKSSTRFRSVTSPALCNPRFPSGLLWRLWMSRLLCARVREHLC